MTDIKKLEEKIGCTIKNEKLFIRALTHSSFSKENYERLEFLGDSVLGFIVADAFYSKTEFNECNLSRARSGLVKSKNLAECYDKLALDEFIVIGKSMNKDLSDSVKSDLVEALIAAVYLDCGMSFTQKFVYKVLDIKKYFGSAPTDSKTKLQEYLQKNGKFKISYIKSPETEKFDMHVLINNMHFGEGNAQNKRDAEQIAAKKALLKIKKINRKAIAANTTLEKYLSKHQNNQNKKNLK